MLSFLFKIINKLDLTLTAKDVFDQQNFDLWLYTILIFFWLGDKRLWIKDYDDSWCSDPVPVY